ncbi:MULTISPECIES: TetR/AcrR family transcriptional regulator [Stutzerimonas]|uniref:TetR/AcrR family transcriptional regulator n=1 Tax=Stutzerimonas TaxID=2901164 RepID=UPI00289F6B2F|nr:TetR/AcrR family transcriptional regulator [Stutzerimonas nitrititolerans]
MNQQPHTMLDFPDLDELAGNRHALRSQRTRDLLLEGMYRLALEKDFREITIQELLDRTGVARSTFYAHFRDKEDLLVAGYEKIGIPHTRVCEVSGDSRVVLDVSSWLFTATERHAELTTSFFSSPSQGIILAHLENILIIQVREHYRKQGLYDSNGLHGEVAVRCFVGALIGLWLWWVRHDYPSSANEMTEAFDSLMNNGTWPAAD